MLSTVFLESLRVRLPFPSLFPLLPPLQHPPHWDQRDRDRGRIELPYKIPRKKLGANGTPGVKSYDVSLDTQTATVVTELPYEKVLQTIKKTGKKVNSGEVDGESKSIELPEDL